METEGRVPATGAFVSQTPFVGRENESARLRARLEEARAGRGGLVMLVGEPGIGKTRTAEEFAERARHEGATVLWGRCFEGEWAPPYGPFAEAIAEYVRDADAEALRADLGHGAPRSRDSCRRCGKFCPASRNPRRSSRTKSGSACSTPSRSS